MISLSWIPRETTSEKLQLWKSCGMLITVYLQVRRHCLPVYLRLLDRHLNGLFPRLTFCLSWVQKAWLSPGGIPCFMHFNMSQIKYLMNELLSYLLLSDFMSLIPQWGNLHDYSSKKASKTVKCTGRSSLVLESGTKKWSNIYTLTYIFRIKTYCTCGVSAECCCTGCWLQAGVTCRSSFLHWGCNSLELKKEQLRLSTARCKIKTSRPCLDLDLHFTTSRKSSAETYAWWHFPEATGATWFPR